jgi:hypothetical protein
MNAPMMPPSLMQTPLAAMQQAQSAAAAAAAAAGGSASQPDAQALGKAGFDDLAGAGHHHHHAAKAPRVPLARRLARLLTPHSANGHDDDDSPLRTAAAELLEALSDGAEDGRERRHAQHDPLQQHALLQQARELLERQPDDGGGQRERLRGKIDAMQADLTARHGAAIDEGGRQAAAFEGALAALEANAPAGPGDTGDTDTLSDLRRLYGAPADGRRDAPLAPAALLDILLKRGGATGAANALGRPPAQMQDALRQRGRSGPRLWLSLQDARCFQLVDTSYALAGELRGAISEQAEVSPRLAQGDVARLLLRLGEPETGQAGALLRQLVDTEHMTPAQRGGACRALRAVIARCPDGMWSGEPLPQRNRLLDQLRDMTIEHDAALPPAAAAPDDALQARLRRQHLGAGSPANTATSPAASTTTSTAGHTIWSAA